MKESRKTPAQKMSAQEAKDTLSELLTEQARNEMLASDARELAKITAKFSRMKGMKSK